MKAADYYLAYAARKNIDLKLEEIVPKLARAAAAANEKRALTETEATDFWTAYSTLAKAVAPVTADSILASGAYFKNAAGEMMRSIPGKGFGLVAITGLVVLVVVQMYWLIGSSLVSEIDRAENEINSAIVTFVATNGEGGKVVQTLYAQNSASSASLFQYCIGDSKKFDTDNIIVRNDVIKLVLDNVGGGNNVPKASNVEAAPLGKLAVEKKEPVIDATPNNVSGISAIKAPLDNAVAEKKFAIDLEKICIDNHRARRNVVYEQLHKWVSFSLNNTEIVDRVEGEYVRELRTARLSLDIMSKYILPLLYGFLGACTFVIRQFSAEVKAELYSRASVTGYMLRMLLGLIAGLSAAWFLNPLVLGAEQKTIAAISPLALAFVAGYSVELLFTAMDRLIGAFTNKPPEGAVPKPS